MVSGHCRSPIPETLSVRLPLGTFYILLFILFIELYAHVQDMYQGASTNYAQMNYATVTCEVGNIFVINP